MRLFSVVRIGVWLACVSFGPPWVSAQYQTPPSADAPVTEARGLPPRAAPSDYQFQGKAGAVTIAADFVGHAVPTQQSAFTSPDYVVVEIGLFGPPEARLKISIEDFTLRISGKKVPLPSQPFGLLFRSLKDPEWEPPPTEPKSKSSIGGGGQKEGDLPPSPPKMPLNLQRAMQQKVQKAALPEGDRALPQAGLIFFQYSGKTENLRSIELVYSGPAGTATLNLQQ